MTRPVKIRFGFLAIGIAGALLGGCTGLDGFGSGTETASGERNCLVRAMYFESNRTSEDGLLAVGTVVMNRVDSTRYPNTICGVVSQHRQFAPGVMTRKMADREKVMAEKMADEVLSGKRSKQVGDAMYFHAMTIRIPYRNVDYVTVAGGNAFYRKKKGGGRQLPPLEPPISAVASKKALEQPKAALAEAEEPAPSIMRASVAPDPAPEPQAPPPAVPIAQPVGATASQIQKSSFGW
ncbi:cell wall hydrolase [Methyloligella sp. 2.7D]|uniref:cell wall hydrolase n=1 Tax=unclassified Methyloligella TaxID=2625955 RepID=UPI00157C9F55|nr:cell wall hydrolase [Methyloligella sp. GL2]QKP76609.1 cell wall hydrolase [Methyloligella sp. GL2]